MPTSPYALRSGRPTTALSSTATAIPSRPVVLPVNHIKGRTRSQPTAINGSPSPPLLSPETFPSSPTEGTGQSLGNALSEVVFIRQSFRSLQVCHECKYVCESEARFKAHLKEPRHVNHYRNMAYQDPKKRQMWLKIWFSTLEAAEEENQSAFEVDESEEDAFLEAMRQAEEEPSNITTDKSKKTKVKIKPTKKTSTKTTTTTKKVKKSNKAIT